MRRRCLDFEMVGACRKNLVNGSSTSIGEQPDEKFASKDKKLVPVKPRLDSSRRVLPGIGLHLNALAITSKDNKSVKIENLSCGISLVSSVASSHSPTTGEELNESLNLASEIDMDPTENGVPLMEDVSQTSSGLVTEEFNPSSPKKKRHAPYIYVYILV